MGKALPSAANAGNAAIGNIANSNIRNRLKGNASMMASKRQSIRGSGLSDNELPYRACTLRAMYCRVKSACK